MKTGKKIIIAQIVLVLIFFVLALRLIHNRAVSSFYSEKPLVAVVIDDFGNNSKGTEEMLALPFKFTGAVMPYMPFSEEEAQKLIKSGKEVILHQPMEAHTGKRSWLGETPILSGMSLDEAQSVFEKNLDQLGERASGFNNHMGSLITEDTEKMERLLASARDRGLFFVDSVTSAKSVGAETAERLGVPYLKRDVFLDSTQDKAKIKENIKKAIEIAEEKGYAVAIGHVGAEGGAVTAQALEEVYDEVKDKVEFVTAGELVEKIKEEGK